jgi:inosine/xanthosine triphosphatase
MKIVVASKNPVKIRAAARAFQRVLSPPELETRALSVPSGVSRQPSSDQETLKGASQRAQNAAQAIPEADYWVGIEGGIVEQDGQMAAFAWVVVLSQNGSGKSRSGAFFLPPEIAELVRQGKELGEADDIVFGEQNSKQKDGAIGLLTGGAVDRQALYEQAVVLALVPFKNPELY